jgi:hypothetical protein
MRLDELEFVPARNTDWVVADVECYQIAHRLRGTDHWAKPGNYSIWLGDTCKYEDLCPLAAQAILYHLLTVTPEVSGGGRDP